MTIKINNYKSLTYAIGDVQGCFDGLERLLEKISFNPNRDKLIFLGDVVNRGDKSLQTLEFIYKNNCQVVLGNHDYHLLACYFGINKPNKKDTFSDVLNSIKVNNLIDFLINQDIVLNKNDRFFVHAGIPPIWNKSQTIGIAQELKNGLTENPEQFIKQTYGNQATIDQNDCKKSQMQYGINAFMRMRFCTNSGSLDFAHKQNVTPDGYKPWFEFENHQLLVDNKIYFGHWSTLKNIKNLNIYPLDTGYIWGGELSCIRLEDNAIFSIK